MFLYGKYTLLFHEPVLFHKAFGKYNANFGLLTSVHLPTVKNIGEFSPPIHTKVLVHSSDEDRACVECFTETCLWNVFQVLCVFFCRRHCQEGMKWSHSSEYRHLFKTLFVLFGSLSRHNNRLYPPSSGNSANRKTAAVFSTTNGASEDFLMLNVSKAPIGQRRHLATNDQREVWLSGKVV